MIIIILKIKKKETKLTWLDVNGIKQGLVTTFSYDPFSHNMFEWLDVNDIKRRFGHNNFNDSFSHDMFE